MISYLASKKLFVFFNLSTQLVFDTKSIIILVGLPFLDCYTKDPFCAERLIINMRHICCNRVVVTATAAAATEVICI